MEMETSTVPPEAPTLTVEEDALASQVLEIIGGITHEHRQSLEEPEERDVWLMEEGDDSVFYSDEDQGEQKQLQTPKTEPLDESDPADPGAQSNLPPEKPAKTSGEDLQLECTTADTQTQPEQNISAERANVEEEEVVQEPQTPNLESFDIPNESCTKLNEGAEVAEQMSSAELQVSDERQLQVNQEPEQDHDVHAPAGFHQNPSPSYSTLPLPKKSGHQKSFNHLTSSAYSTVSYRKIRRGNTRQKIDEFEHMIMNM